MEGGAQPEFQVGRHEEVQVLEVQEKAGAPEVPEFQVEGGAQPEFQLPTKGHKEVPAPEPENPGSQGPRDALQVPGGAQQVPDKNIAPEPPEFQVPTRGQGEVPAPKPEVPGFQVQGSKLWVPTQEGTLQPSDENPVDGAERRTEGEPRTPPNPQNPKHYLPGNTSGEPKPLTSRRCWPCC